MSLGINQSVYTLVGLRHRDHCIHLGRAWARQNIGMPLLLDFYTSKNITVLHLKNTSFWPSADVKPK